jgi:hypothetical protein
MTRPHLSWLAWFVAATPALAQSFAQWSFEEANALALHPRWLALQYAEFDTRDAAPAVADELAARADTQTCFLVQFDGPISERHRSRAAACGVELLDYVPNFAFVARGSAAARAELAASPEVVWSGALHPAYKLERRLLDADANDRSARRLVVVGFRGVEREALEAQLATRKLELLSANFALERWLVVVEATAADARALAASDDVQWIEPEPQLELRNNNMTWAVQTNVNLDRKVWNRGITGVGQVLGHIDSALALNSCFFSDPSGAPIGPTHRKLVFASSSGGDTHGTHTAGSLAGDAAPVSGSTSERGIAFGAKLAHTTGLPTTTFASVAGAHAAVGARVHSNSWGDDTTTAYNTLCAQIDALQWSDEQQLVVFSTSNSPSVRNPENAKNLLAVGATLNGAGANNLCSGGAGPTADGRRKPELFAPGCNVLSAGVSGCSTSVLSGTSMAAPAVAGAAALVRQYFMDGFHPSGAANAADAFTPSGALLKALLVNSGQDMTSIAGYPSDQEGWGRIELDNALYFAGDQSRLVVFDVPHAAGLATGQSASHAFSITSSAVTLRVTLAYSDAPGALNAANPVVNDLDLVLTGPTGQVFLGNVFAAGVSTSGGAPDKKNNLERILVPAPATGTWVLEVSGANVPLATQGYALCVTGDVVEGAGGGSSNPTAYCLGGLSTNFCQGQLISFGVARAGASSGFTLSATNLEGARPALVFYGVNGRDQRLWAPSSVSELCVKGPLQRVGPALASGTLGLCNGTLDVDWSAFTSANPFALGAPFSAGALVNSQVWYRDPLAAGGANLANALEFTVQP